VELYETARFFTMTADHVESTPTEIRERRDALTGVYSDHIADETETNESQRRSEPTDNAWELDEGDSGSSRDMGADESLTDEELLARARAASNSAKFEELWRGDTHGYDSQSEADMALACLLAFWTGGDAKQMDRLFRRSGLMREKWDAVHYADGSTYGEKTVERACNVTTEYYSPSDEQGQQVQTDSDKREYDSSVTPETASTSDADIQPPDGDSTTYEREKARIETITRLEQRLRELEAENERLREERDAERAKRKELETDNESERQVSSSSRLVRAKRFFLRGIL
jgi:primase-polymerase (primpol)-like protein